jgi:hypothetical protein
MRAKRDHQFYETEVLELISECTHGSEFDHEEFDNKVSGLKAAALVDGMRPEDFNDIVAKAFKTVPQKANVA